LFFSGRFCTLLMIALVIQMRYDSVAVVLQ
jgi:hypothetical protein